jgi:hypothetical protein
VLAVAVLVSIVVLALVGALAHHLLAGRSAPGPGRGASGVVVPAPSARATPRRSSAVAGEPDDAGVSSKESANAAAAFVDAWLTKDRSQRLARLKATTVSSLYEGLTYTDPAEIPTAHRVGRPRVEDAGAYLVRYRVTLSDRSQVLVSTVYDGTGWLASAVDPVVG